MIWEQGAIAVIPSKSNRKLPKEFDAQIYKETNKTERFLAASKLLFAVSQPDMRKRHKTSWQ